MMPLPRARKLTEVSENLEDLSGLLVSTPKQNKFHYLQILKKLSFNLDQVNLRGISQDYYG